MANWTRRRTVIGGDVIGDDWCVKRDGWVVGRVKLMITAHEGYLWGWSTLTHPSASGRTSSLEQGLEQVRSHATEKWSCKPHT